MNNLFKNLAIWLVIGIVLMTVFNQFNTRQVAQQSVEYSQFLDEVKAGKISKVVIQGRQLEATTNEGKRITSYAPPDLWMVSDLLRYDVKVVAKPEEEQSFLMNIFVSWFPMLLLIGVWIFFMRQMQGGGRGGDRHEGVNVEQPAKEHRHLARHRPGGADRRQAVRRAPDGP